MAGGSEPFHKVISEFPLRAFLNLNVIYPKPPARYKMIILLLRGRSGISLTGKAYAYLNDVM